MGAPHRRPVDFWFDPICPWAWLSSRWMLQVERVRPVTVRWHLMSLAVLNEGRALSQDYLDALRPGRPIGRVVAAARTHGGPAAVAALYAELGRRFHNEAQPRTREVALDALRAAGLPASLADAWSESGWDEAVERSHRDGITRVGLEVGTPIISVDGIAFFGPVVTPAPLGEAAGKLWDGVLLVSAEPGFYELKRSRDREPAFDIGATAHF